MSDAAPRPEQTDARFPQAVLAGTLLLHAAVVAQVLDRPRVLVAVLVLELARMVANATLSRAKHRCAQSCLFYMNLVVNVLSAHVTTWVLAALLYLPFHFLVTESFTKRAWKTNLAAVILTNAVALHDGVPWETMLSMTVFAMAVWIIVARRGLILHDKHDELRKSREQYRALVETTRAVPFVWDDEQKSFTYVGPQAKALVDADWTAPGFLQARVHPEDRAKLRAVLESVIGPEARGEAEVDARVKTDAGAWLFLRIIFTADRDGKVRGVMVDQTERQQLEVELRYAQKLSAIGSLAAGMAHEMNTPMQVLLGNMQFMKKSVTKLHALAAFAGPELREIAEDLPCAVDESLEGLDRVAAIVTAMKRFAHPSNGQLSLVHLRELAETTATISRHEWKLVADLVIDVDDALPRVPALRDELGTVLVNLIVNAAHAIAEKNAQTHTKGHIRLAGKSGDDFVEVSVSDDGSGIPDDIKTQVFDPFFTTKPVGKGAGQGLSVAYGVVVNKHHGSIAFESQAGVGTTFRIRLPRYRERSAA